LQLSSSLLVVAVRREEEQVPIAGAEPDPSLRLWVLLVELPSRCGRLHSRRRSHVRCRATGENPSIAAVVFVPLGRWERRALSYSLAGHAVTVLTGWLLCLADSVDSIRFSLFSLVGCPSLHGWLSLWGLFSPTNHRDFGEKRRTRFAQRKSKIDNVLTRSLPYYLATVQSSQCRNHKADR